MLNAEKDKKISDEDKLDEVAKNTTFTTYFNNTLNAGDLNKVNAIKNAENT